MIAKLQRPSQSILGIGYELIISGKTSGGRFELMRFVVPPGVGSAPHVHRREDETFILRSGTLELSLDGKVSNATAGDTVFLPRDVPHLFHNSSTEVCDFFCIVTPATLASFFGSFARDWPRTANVPAPPQPDEIDALIAAAELHGIELLGGGN